MIQKDECVLSGINLNLWQKLGYEKACYLNFQALGQSHGDTFKKIKEAKKACMFFSGYGYGAYRTFRSKQVKRKKSLSPQLCHVTPLSCVYILISI